MKPRSKPGKIGSSGRAARAKIADAKPLSKNQMRRVEKALEARPSKEGRGGRRVNWDIDLEQGELFAKKEMPYRDNPAIEEDGIRKYPKNGR